MYGHALPLSLPLPVKLKFQQPLLIRFCDGMGIEHNGEGSVEGVLPDELDPAKLSETVDGLYADVASVPH